MAVVTGTLKDFGLAALAAYSPQIIFTASGPAVSGSNLFSTKPIVVTPAADGTFTVPLQPTDDLHPAVWYIVRVQWLDSVGGFVGMDFVDWKLFVPTSGGAIGDIIAAPANPAQVWVSLTAPANPTPGTWWLESNPNNVNDTANTGNLYEWSN